MPVEYLQPDGMHHNPAFSQAILLPAGARTLIIGGQNAVDANGQLVGKGDIGAQTAKALENLQLCLKAAGATLEQLVQVLRVAQDGVVAHLLAGAGHVVADGGGVVALGQVGRQFQRHRQALAQALERADEHRPLDRGDREPRADRALVLACG